VIADLTNLTAHQAGGVGGYLMRLRRDAPADYARLCRERASSWASEPPPEAELVRRIGHVTSWLEACILGAPA